MISFFIKAVSAIHNFLTHMYVNFEDTSNDTDYNRSNLSPKSRGLTYKGLIKVIFDFALDQ